jgi:hypothetical protein
MSKFRLPRRLKKNISGNIWLYPADEEGNKEMALPSSSQKDYDAVRTGIARSILYRENLKVERKAYKQKINAEAFVTDEELRNFIDDIFAEKHRNSSYNILLKAKKHPQAVIAYYNFINIYRLSRTDSSYTNICCLAVDRAKELLRS